jgi:hypothetical protein
MIASLSRFATLLLAAVGVLAAASAGRGDQPAVSLTSLLGEMTDRDAIARWPAPAYVCKQASSYDRLQTDPSNAKTWFANKDYEQFIRVETRDGRREWVIMEHDGPGCVTRFWVPLHGPRKNQVIRFYFDGSAEPGIAVKFNELLSGRGFVKPPLAFVASDEKSVEGVGGDMYLPIPFAKGCKITLDELPFYYAVNYRAYEPGTRVTTFTMAQFEAARDVLKQTAEALNQDEAAAGAQPRGHGPIAPGAELPLELPAGPGAVRAIVVQIDPHDAPQVLRSTVLEATFDGEPAVWCPLGEFFGCGVRLCDVHDRYRSVEKEGRLTCRWVMPYQKSARLAIRNVGKQPIAATLSARAEPCTWDERSMHFHASWRFQHPLRTRPMSDWNYVEIQGRGVYAGDTLTVFSPVPAWYGEGDERIYVDGEKMPSHMGTGTEDYYGYAWGMARHFSSPFLSMPLRDEKSRGDWRGYTTTSRLRLLDGVPMQSSLKMDMEIWNWADTTVAYAAGTFWYARPGATCNRGPVPEEAARELIAWPPPPPPEFRGAIECEEMKVVSATKGMRIGTQDVLSDWSGGRQLFVQATKPGDYVELLVAEGVAGPRRITLHGTKSYDYGILRLSVNGKAVERPFDGFSEKSILSGPIDLGVFDPKDGRFVLRAEVIGSNPASRGPRYYFGLDCTVLTTP